MNVAVKIVIGTILLIGGIAWTYFFLPNFISLVKGVVGPVVAVLGLFVVWLELDELRIQRELDIEEKKASKKEEKKEEKKQSS
jgi:predicted tellurium resistance membrane protein TerC